MINKEKFVKVINTLKEENDFWNEVDALYRKYRNILLDGVAPIPVVSEIVIDLLEDNLGITSDYRGYSTLSWWIYEANFGQKEDFVNSILYTDKDGKEISCQIVPRTPEKLYDLLLWEKEFFNNEQEC